MENLSCLLVASRFCPKVLVEIGFTQTDLVNLTTAVRIWTEPEASWAFQHVEVEKGLTCDGRL
jgi:hypothetical protein